MRSTVMDVSPELAKKWLQEKNTCNRAIRSSVVNRYARDMAAGQWKVSHQGIAFDHDGTLLDGQHRLGAIVLSGVTVQMLVVFDVESESQMVMDDHARRAAEDNLNLGGRLGVSRADVAMARCVSAFFNVPSRSPTTTEIGEIIWELMEGMDFAIRKRVKSSSSRGINSAPVWTSIALAWYYAPDIEKLERFCDIAYGRQFASGEGSAAAVMLRELCLRNGATAGGESERHKLFLKSCRAISAFLADEPLSRLHATETEFVYPLSVGRAR